MIKNILSIILVLLFILLIPPKTTSYEAFDGNYTYKQNNEIDENPADKISTDEEVLLILDFSKSMNEPLGDTKRYILLIDTINSILRQIPKTTKIGMRIFGLGSTVDLKTFNSNKQRYEIFCTASKLIIPINSNNNSLISDKLSQAQPRGATPIYYSLKQAIEGSDFNSVNSKKRIILVTDGRENCGGDPCMYIKSVMQKRKDITIDVIGITLNKNDYSQLSCISDSAKGNFYTVDNADNFKNVFRNAFSFIPADKMAQNTENNFDTGFSNENYTPPKPQIKLDYDTSVKFPPTQLPKHSIIKYNNYAFEFDI